MFGLRIHRVTGQSMLPTLKHGDYVLSYRRKKAYCIGDVVVLNHAEWGCIIKRVSHTREDCVKLCGDNTLESLSSSTIGWQSLDNIIGRVIFQTSPR